MFKSSGGERVMEIVNNIVLLLIAVTMLFPFLYIFSVSFSSVSDVLNSDFLLWPKEWVTDAYSYILGSDQFIRSLGVTVYITIVGTFVNLVFTSTMAYSLTRNIIGQRLILFLVLFTILF